MTEEVATKENDEEKTYYGKLPAIHIVDGHAVINGRDITVRQVLETLVMCQGAEDAARELNVRVEYVQAAIAYAVTVVP